MTCVGAGSGGCDCGGFVISGDRVVVGTGDADGVVDEDELVAPLLPHAAITTAAPRKAILSQLRAAADIRFLMGKDVAA